MLVAGTVVLESFLPDQPATFPAGNLWVVLFCLYSPVQFLKFHLLILISEVPDFQAC